MAREGANTYKRFHRQYPGVYARTAQTNQSRVGKRNKETTQFITFRGLDTVTDDFNVQRTTSPNMENWRFSNERYREQGAQLISRPGTRFLNDYGTVFTDIKPEDEEDTLFFSISKQILTQLDSGTDLVVGGSIRLRNRSGARGTLLLHYQKDNKVVCTAKIDLNKVTSNWKNYSYRLIGGVSGRYDIRLQIIDEFGDSPQEQSVEREIEISATAQEQGLIAHQELPALTDALREKPLDWQPTSLAPLFGTMINNNKFFGDFIEVTVRNTRYLVFAMEEGSRKRIGRFNLENNDIDMIEGGILPTGAKVFSGVLADGMIVFVDGISRLKYIDIRDWTVHTANATEPDLQAPEGAKYIALINNRIYLANLPDSPNYVTASQITREGAQFFNFFDKFYSPNISTYDARNSPITGLFQYTDNTLAIWREDGMSIYSAPDGFEFGSAKQLDTFSNGIGIAQKEDLVNYNGALFFFNKSEGFRRFSGADATITSRRVDNLIRQIPENSERYLYSHNNKVHINIDDYQLVFDLTASSAASAWLKDTQRYVHRTFTEQKSDRLWASHNQYLCFMELNAEDVYTDFDCAIPCVYETQYCHSQDSTGDMLVHKMMAHLSQMSSTTWRIGFDKDHQDNPAVWTKVLFKQYDPVDSPEDVFENTQDAPSTMINIAPKSRCYVGQMRVQAYAYNDHIGIQALTMETENIQAK